MIVAQYHGQGDAESAAEEFDRVFKQHDVPADMPEIPVSAGKIGIVELICLAEFAESRGQAKRLVKQGAVTIDGQSIASIDAEVEPADGQVLKVGKRRFGQLKIF